MKTQLTLILAILAATTSATVAAPLSDDFNDGVIDPTKWTVQEPFADSSVTEANGYIEFQNRGRINTMESFTSPITVDGRFQLSNIERSNLKIVLRSDGIGYAGSSEVQGIVVQFQAREDAAIQNQIGIYHNDSTGTQTGASWLTTPLSLDTWYDFTIVDDGGSVALYFDGATTPTLSLATTWSAGQLVSFYNREGAAAGSTISDGGIARLDSVEIVPEPSAFALLLVSGFALFCRRRL